MTIRQVYEAILIELNKNYGTPDLLLEDFLHFINKGVTQHTQKRYNVYDTNQQTTDDLQVLKDTVILEAFEVTTKGIVEYHTQDLPQNYFHLQNCILEYKLKNNFKCYTQDYVFSMPAKRMTSDQESVVLNNAWLRPTYRTPYYKVLTASPVGSVAIQALKLDMENKKIVMGAAQLVYDGDANQTNLSTLNAAIVAYLKSEKAYDIAKNAATAGSKLSVTYGKDGSVFELTKVYCDYIRYPKIINLTYEQLDMVSDTSDQMEFKDDVCHEIIKETVLLLLLNTGNPQIQGYSQVNAAVPPQGGIQQQQQSQ